MTKQVRFIPIEACGLKGRAAEDGQQSRTIEGKPIVFGFRPEAIVLGEQADACCISGQVELTEMLGDNANVYMNIDEDHSILKVTPHEIPEMDSQLTFSVPYENVYLFDAVSEEVIL